MFKFKTDIKSMGVHRATNSYNLKLKLKQNARLSVERLLLHKVFLNKQVGRKLNEKTHLNKVLT